MKKRFNDARSRAFFISLALHALVLAIVLFAPQDLFSPPRRDVVEISYLAAPTESTVVPTPTENAKPTKKIFIEKNQVVDQDLKPLNDETPENSRFLSAHNQVVKKQTVAVQHGEFQNSGESVTKAGRGGQKGEETPEKKIDFLPKFDVAEAIQHHDDLEKQKEADLVKNAEAKTEKTKVKGNEDNQGQGDAAIDQSGTEKKEASQTLDYIKDLDSGLQTLLSTKEFVYYTYYNRIRRQLTQYWGPKVREHMTKFYRSGRNIASTDDKITRLLITLDPSGNIVRTQVIGDSGVQDLDEAAVEAFRSAAPFPNPPRGMIDPDGLIKIRWDFILEG